MATIKDIAARCGVSIATVSKHINGIPVKIVIPGRRIVF